MNEERGDDFIRWERLRESDAGGGGGGRKKEKKQEKDEGEGETGVNWCSSNRKACPS